MTQGLPRAGVLLAILLAAGTSNVLGQSVLPDAPSPAPATQTDADDASQMDGTIALGTVPLQNRPWMSPCQAAACSVAAESICCGPLPDSFQRFLYSATSHAMTPHQKFRLAVKNTIDPFNVLTIVGVSAIAVASDPHSAYGPGLKGFARNSSVVFTEGATGDFFGTFLIPSLAHQDPHYHRMPNASARRRIAHAIFQVVWTQSDTGKPMFNYATVFGTVASDAVNDLYVPGRKTDPGSSAARIGTSLATDPIDNFVTEFVPDIARHIRFHVVFLQRVVNQVALEEGRNASSD